MNAMNVLLFPASVLVQGSGSQWQQTVAIILNSFFLGEPSLHVFT